MTRLPKKLDEFTMLKQFTLKFIGLTIKKKKGKTAQSGSKPPCPLSGCYK
jgi:hypothetical protein